MYWSNIGTDINISKFSLDLFTTENVEIFAQETQQTHAVFLFQVTVFEYFYISNSKKLLLNLSIQFMINILVAQIMRKKKTHCC